MSITARCYLACLDVKAKQPAHVRLTQGKLTACFIDNAAVSLRVKNWLRLEEGTKLYCRSQPSQKKYFKYGFGNNLWYLAILFLNYTVANCTSKTVPEFQSIVKY
jgi:hypothetical protein